jgi:hypothetical protein
MPEIRIISNSHRSLRTKIRTIADALDKLAGDGELSANAQLTLLVRSDRGQPALCAALLFQSAKGDRALFPLPISRGCWAKGTLGDRFRLPLEALDDAQVDGEGNVALVDGRHFHAVEFDVVPLHYKLPELDEAIVYLTICYRNAKARCLRNDYGVVGIDYATLPQLHVRNVEALTNYINARLVKLPRASGAPPFKKVSVAAVNRVLSFVGIQQGERAQRKQSVHHATASP